MNSLPNPLPDCEPIEPETDPADWPDWCDTDRWELGPDPDAVRTVKTPPELPPADDCFEWRIQSRAFRLRNHGPDCPYCHGMGDSADPDDMPGSWTGHPANENEWADNLPA